MLKVVGRVESSMRRKPPFGCLGHRPLRRPASLYSFLTTHTRRVILLAIAEAERGRRLWLSCLAMMPPRSQGNASFCRQHCPCTVSRQYVRQALVAASQPKWTQKRPTIWSVLVLVPVPILRDEIQQWLIGSKQTERRIERPLSSRRCA